MSGESPSIDRGDAAIEALRARLVERSGFPRDAVAGPRLAAQLSRRAAELGLADASAAAARALDEHDEYARIEAHFSPPETWLFRYRESVEFLRTFAASRGAREIAALVAGAGGWSEPCSIAAALSEGSRGARIAVCAVDRNPEVFGGEPRFSGLALRGERPAFAHRWLRDEGGALVATAALRACITVEIARIEAFIDRCVRASRSFDVIACRNVAIYQAPAVRAATYAGLASLLKPDGVLLVGHAEVMAAAEATGLAPIGCEGAFALARAPVSKDSAVAAPAMATGRAAPAARADRSPATPPSMRAVERAREPLPALPVDSLDPVAAARAACTARPTDAALHAALAEALLAAGEPTEAWQSVQRALYLDRGNEAALLTAARLSDARGATDEAARFRARALRAHLERMRDDPGRMRDDPGRMRDAERP
jgi:chemotaxis methyl-accepting protein methylase